MHVESSRNAIGYGCWTPVYRCYVKPRETILTESQRVLGNRTLAERWFTLPVRGLDYRPPCFLLSTESGYEQIQTCLARIEHGVYI
ncbi:antitoxin Xre/MbcA/ParS toxin-binding domain-containing protein [Pseudomonas cichorii]|uniref:antitoxin Xre/MbcA/ParS toxin-binding domain-containing protein n=1 Tax=Pseudomonas cichorii TaxID=36746 RepID=UPI00191018E0